MARLGPVRVSLAGEGVVPVQTRTHHCRAVDEIAVLDARINDIVRGKHHLRLTRITQLKASGAEPQLLQHISSGRPRAHLDRLTLAVRADELHLHRLAYRVSIACHFSSPCGPCPRFTLKQLPSLFCLTILLSLI